MKWSFDNIGRRFFLVGSDYVWPHSINAIIKDQLKALRAELVGEDYIFFGSADVQEAVSRIKAAQPDVIFSSVVGDSNIPFYRESQAAGIKPEKIPVKMLVVSKLMAKPWRWKKVRRILVFVDADARASFGPRTWGHAAFDAMGIETHLCQVTPRERKALQTAQRRQDLRLNGET